VKNSFCLTLLTALLLNGGNTFAQSTLGDPAPFIGDGARGTAGITNINSAIENSGKNAKNKRSPAETERRKMALKQVSICKKEARAQYPAGDKRRYELTHQCEQNFKAQKATWSK
jgi:hypothetical protein